MEEHQIPNDIDMSDMKIYFGGQTHQIEANTLLNSLFHFTEIVLQTNTAFNKILTANKKITINVKAHSKGSFGVDVVLISTLIDRAKDLFTHEHITYAKDVAESVGCIYAFARFLKGKKPKSVEKTDNSIIVENNSGQIQNFDLKGATVYLDNPVVKEIIRQAFQTLDNDVNIDSFSLLNENNESLVTIPRSEFAAISNNDNDELLNNEKNKNVTVILRIISLSFDVKKKWQFIYNGNPITGKIKDEAFAEIIKNGEAFSNGDALEVEMDIRQEYDEVSNAYINKAYTINHIIRHIKRSETTNLNFDNEK